MAKIQCPHCKAMNQDVSLDDPCWQCGTILSAPVSAIETGVGPPSSGANPANLTGSSNAAVQSQIERNQPASSTRPTQLQEPRRSKVNAVAIAALILAAVIILIWAYFHVRR